MLTATIIFTVLVAAWGESGAVAGRIGALQLHLRKRRRAPAGVR
jgi:hypothetical protein